MSCKHASLTQINVSHYSSKQYEKCVCWRTKRTIWQFRVPSSGWTFCQVTSWIHANPNGHDREQRSVYRTAAGEEAGGTFRTKWWSEVSRFQFVRGENTNWETGDESVVSDRLLSLWFLSGVLWGMCRLSHHHHPRHTAAHNDTTVSRTTTSQKSRNIVMTTLFVGRQEHWISGGPPLEGPVRGWRWIERNDGYHV